MQTILRILLAGLVTLVLLPHDALAQGNGHAYGKEKHHEQSDDDEDRDDHEDHDRDRHSQVRISIVFSAREPDIIRDYYRDHDAGLPPGLAKRRGNLPPGLQKQLQRNGTLPPGLQKRLEPFPDELEGRLPELPHEYERAVIGVDVLILDRRTQRIVDIIHDLLRR